MRECAHGLRSEVCGHCDLDSGAAGATPDGNAESITETAYRVIQVVLDEPVQDAFKAWIDSKNCELFEIPTNDGDLRTFAIRSKNLAGELRRG